MKNLWLIKHVSPILFHIRNVLVDQALLPFLEITLTFVCNRDILIFFVINASIRHTIIHVQK